MTIFNSIIKDVLTTGVVVDLLTQDENPPPPGEKFLLDNTGYYLLDNSGQPLID